MLVLRAEWTSALTGRPSDTAGRRRDGVRRDVGTPPCCRPQKNSFASPASTGHRGRLPLSMDGSRNYLSWADRADLRQPSRVHPKEDAPSRIDPPCLPLWRFSSLATGASRSISCWHCRLIRDLAPMRSQGRHGVESRPWSRGPDGVVAVSRMRDNQSFRSTKDGERVLAPNARSNRLIGYDI